MDFIRSDKSYNELIEVTKDKIIVSKDINHELELRYDNNIDIYVNGKMAKSGCRITSNDIIKYEVLKANAKRELKINTEKLEARISVIHNPELISRIFCDVKNNSILEVDYTIEKGEIPKWFTEDEIEETLRRQEIIHGIDREAIKDIVMGKKLTDVLVASGTMPIDDEEDRINEFFKSSKNILNEESNERIDYRSINVITSVDPNSELAELIVGKEGTDGGDIYGNVIPRKLKKCLQLKAGSGCKIKDNKVISIIEGQPSMKGGTFYVHKVFETATDVDMKSGNIKFIGDIKISQSVKEGMTVESGNRVEIGGNVETAKIIAHGDSFIRGSVISSEVRIGDKDIQNQSKLDDLILFLEELKSLIQYVLEIKDKSILPNKSDGELIKVLLETKLKGFSLKCFKVLNYIGDENYEDIKREIRKRFIGLGPLSIRFISELVPLEEIITKEISKLKENLFIPIDLELNYVQDSDINATGSIYINGKGQYTSNIKALGDIVFTKDNAVSRGGVLTANGNIYAKVLGSEAGISSTLKVSKKSIIEAKVAHINTVLYFGERKYVFDSLAENIREFLDETGEIQVIKKMN